MSNSDREKTWRSLAARLVWKVNFGWWLQFLTPFLVITSLVVGSTILILRTQRIPIENVWFLGGAGLVVAAVLTCAWLMAKRRFIQPKDGLIRLEKGLSLHNALTAADHGVGKWPAVPCDEAVAMQGAGFSWRWPVVVAPFFVALISIVASLFIPIPDLKAAADLPPAEPSAWEQMEEMLETLEEQEVIEEEAIEEVRDKIVELRNQPENEWFSHSSMEASDTLRETLRQQINNLGAEMETAERDLNALQNFAAQMSKEAKEMILAEYEQALKNMEMSGLTMSQELLKQLAGIDPKTLAQAQMKGMNKEQMDQLRKQLKEAAKAFKEMQGLGMGKEGKLSEMEKMTPEMQAWLMKMQGQGPGRAGIDRGPGTAPLFYGDDTDLKTKNIEQIKNKDMSKAAPGELLGVGTTKHDVEEIKIAPKEAGAVKSTGKGGDTVWRESLMPQEKAVLKRYFK